MEGRVYDAAGQGWDLPVLLRWDVSHGFCSPCDCFEVEFLYEPEMLGTLRAACRFSAFHEGRTVFCGVVDEVELSADDSGRSAVVRGRGMQALLLDSEAESADYSGADLDFILQRHVRALGVAEIERGALAGSAAAFSVSSGESHWSVLSRFAEFCLGVRPRFSPEGAMVLDGGDSGRRFQLDGAAGVGAQRLTIDRYGVLSAAVVKNRVLRTSVTVENEAFQALGGQCVRVLNVPRHTGFDAMRHTGAYRIAKSREEFFRLRVELPGLFAAFPGDRAAVTGSSLGVSGEMLVWSSRCFADAERAGTVLELRQL